MEFNAIFRYDNSELCLEYSLIAQFKRDDDDESLSVSSRIVTDADLRGDSSEVGTRVAFTISPDGSEVLSLRKCDGSEVLSLRKCDENEGATG